MCLYSSRLHPTTQNSPWHVSVCNVRGSMFPWRQVHLCKRELCREPAQRSVHMGGGAVIALSLEGPGGRLALAFGDSKCLDPHGILSLWACFSLEEAVQLLLGVWVLLAGAGGLERTV